jgi:hypothetical protein
VFNGAAQGHYANQRGELRHGEGAARLPHPVLEKIDRTKPYFTRKLIRRGSDGDHECKIQIWLPVQMDDGCWLSAVHITALDLPPISAMPGEDPLDALLRAVAFARDVVEHRDGSFLFGDMQWEGAGLPISLNRGFLPRQLAAIEAEALALADDAQKLVWPR